MGARAQRRATQRHLRRASAGVSVTGTGYAGMPPGADTSHRAASITDSILQTWNPGLDDANTPWRFDRTTAVARTRDLIANNPYAGAAVDQAIAMQVGPEIRYSARHELMAQRLHISNDAAFKLATEIEAAWDAFANDKLRRGDFEQKLTFGQQVELIARHKFGDGEGLAVLRMDKGKLPPGWAWGTSVQIIDPDKLDTPTAQPMTPNVVHGIETDTRGRVIAYHFRNAHPNDRANFANRFTFERVPARMPWGRPVVLHIFDTTRAGQLRGVSKFVRGLRAFKALENYTDKELASASLNAAFGAYIKTTKTPGEAGEALGLEQFEEFASAREAYYKGVNPRLGNVRIPVLAPNDEFSLNAVPRHVASFQGFVATMLQGVAAGLGLASSQLTMDFSKTNFSSWRGEMLQVWRGVMRDRALIASQFCDPVLLAVIEEGIDTGLINPPDGCPDLYECTTGWLAGRWIGPARGTIDPTGEVDGAVKRISAGLSTHEDEALELGGGDYEAIKGQVGYERELWGGSDLTPTALREMLGAPQPGAAAALVPANGEQPENVGKGNVVEPPTESAEDADAAGADALA